MRQALRARIAIAVLSLVILAGTFVLLTPSVDAFGGLCTYYSNASHTTVVGQRGSDCCGNPVSWGIITQHRECYVEYCIWCPPPTE